MQLFQRICSFRYIFYYFIFSDVLFLFFSAIDLEIPMVQINNQIGGFGKI